MKKYKFTKKYDFWKPDHHQNFSYIKNYFCGSDYLRNNCSEMGRLTFLEIGVFEAKTSVWLLDNILLKDFEDRNKGILYCIEPNLTKNGEFNLAQHIGDFLLFNKPSFETLIGFLIDRSIYRFDLIYVDGDHNACGLLEDLVLSWKLLKIGGIMLIDDYEMETLDPWFYVSHPEFKNNPKLRFTHPRIAIDAFKNIYRGQYDVVIDNYQVGLKKVIELK